MATYVFGGGPVQPSSISYISINLNQNITLSWPISYLDTVNVVGSMMDVIPTAGGFTLTLPDARLVGAGTSITMNNRSGFAFALHRNDGSLLQNFAAGNILFFYLIDTTTAAGTWITIPFGGGVAAVTSVDAISTSPATLGIAGVPIVDAGVITFTPGAELVGLQAIPGSGYVVRTAPGTYANRAFVQGANMALTNPNGIAGATTIALSDVLAGLVSVTSTQIQGGNVQIIGNAVQSTNLNGDISLVANGTGTPRLGLLGYPGTDTGVAGLVPISNGAQSLTLGRIAANNMLINGGFQVCQRGFNFTNNGALIYTADRWQFGPAGAAVNCQMNVVSIDPANNAARVGRVAADATAGQVTFGQSISITGCGNASVVGSISYSFRAAAGANFSSVGSVLTVRVIAGTGNNDISGLSSVYTGNQILDTTDYVLAAGFQTFTKQNIAVPGNITQMAIVFFYTTPAIAAGAQDNFLLRNVQFNLGPAVSAYESISYEDMLLRCQPYFQTDFFKGVTPAQNVGLGSGETEMIATQVGASAGNFSASITGPAMRVIPAVTLYNPSALNAFPWNNRTVTTCTAAVVGFLSLSSFLVNATAPAGTAVGDTLGFHYTKDAELT